MAKDFDKKDRDELAKKLQVTQSECEQFNQFYDNVILPRIKKKYLSALLSVVEDLIDMKIRDDVRNEFYNNKSEKEAGPIILRRYSIVLSDRLPCKNARAYTVSFSQGAIIAYDPRYSEKDICFSIARELGNLLIRYGIIPGAPHTENLASFFAHFTSDGV